jgi:hypothetical protein
MINLTARVPKAQKPGEKTPARLRLGERTLPGLTRRKYPSLMTDHARERTEASAFEPEFRALPIGSRPQIERKCAVPSIGTLPS